MMKCPKCNGKEFERLKYKELPLKVECWFCCGREELDWIDCIFGVADTNSFLWYPPIRYDKLRKEISNRIENEMSSM